MPTFLLKTPHKNDPAEQLDHFLEPPGNRLVVAYGYLRVADDNRADYEKILNWLRGDKERELLIIFGIRGSFKWASRIDKLAKQQLFQIDSKVHVFRPEVQEFEKCLSTLEDLFGSDLFSAEVASQIDIFGSANFHAKFMYLEEKNFFDDRKSEALAVQMGSSNFTQQARYRSQIELDVYFDGADEALADAAVVVKEAIEAAKLFQYRKVTELVETQKLRPWRKDQWEADKLAYVEELTKEADQQWDDEQAHWDEERAEHKAEIDSNLAQDIGPMRGED